MQIDKQDIFKTVPNSPNDKHFIFVCGEERSDDFDWVLVTLQAELFSIESTVEIPRDKNIFVMCTTDIESLSDIDKTVITFCRHNGLDYALFSLEDPDLIKFFKGYCGYGLVFGDVTNNKYLDQIIMTLETLSVPYTIYP